MKKRLFLLSLALVAVSLVSCTKGGQDPTTSGNNSDATSYNPDDFPGDGYVDTLPDSMDDGEILHCFGWTFKQIEDNLATIANAGFMGIQTLPVQQPKGGGASWWAFYQPLSFSIADNSPLGTKEDLRSLCTAADNYGLKIIVDVVFNHLANVNDKTLEEDGTPVVSPSVADYEPEIYAARNDATNPTFHHNKNATGSGAITQYYAYGALPDLNTANSLVQERSLAFLKECIDVGVDGFRFDAAKHIETPQDPQYPSDFWPNTLGVAKTYYKEKTGDDLYAYGEVLNEVGGGRDISYYTEYMNVTDNTYIQNIASASVGKKGEKALEAEYGKNTDVNNLVTWVESHDTFADETTHISEKKVARQWAVIAARKDAQSLFFSRTDNDITLGKISSHQFEDENIAVANRFHNRFIGADEALGASGSLYWIERFSDNDEGVVLVDFAAGDTAEVTFEHLNDGGYYDQITGNFVSVVNHKATIALADSGICILTKSKNMPRPTISLSNYGDSFVGTMNVTITVSNASSSSYTINGGTPVSFTGSTTVTLGSDIDENRMVNLLVNASNSQFSTSKQASYQSIDLIDGYFNIVNLKSAYLTDYELYYWAWNSNGSSWLKNYTVQDGVVLIDFSSTQYTSFLLAIFEKGYEITNLTEWDSNLIKQTADISISKGFYDASAF